MLELNIKAKKTQPEFTGQWSKAHLYHNVDFQALKAKIAQEKYVYHKVMMDEYLVLDDWLKGV